MRAKSAGQERIPKAEGPALAGSPAACWPKANAPKAACMVSIATWNINSVRLRMPIVARFLKEHAPDVLCLQEIKCQEHQFPYEAFRELGYGHAAVHGQKGYHGVATVSRIPPGRIFAPRLAGQWRGTPCRCRAAGRGQGHDSGECLRPGRRRRTESREKPEIRPEARLPRTDDALGRRDRPANDDRRRFQHRPARKRRMEPQAICSRLSATHRSRWKRLQRFMDAHSWIDIGREFIRDPERYYSWWSYRAKDWRKGDRGTPARPYVGQPRSCQTGDRSPDIRGIAEAWEKPSEPYSAGDGVGPLSAAGPSPSRRVALRDRRTAAWLADRPGRRPGRRPGAASGRNRGLPPAPGPNGC